MLKKYWKHLNLFGAAVTFLLGVVLTVFGINGLAPYNPETELRARQTSDIEQLRAEFLETTAKSKFAHEAGLTVMSLEFGLLVLVFIVFGINDRLIRKVEQ